MIKTLYFLAIAGFIVGGQYFLALFAKSLTEPWTLSNLIMHSLRTPAIYGAVISYAIGLGLYLMLLRSSGMVETNVPIIVMIIALNVFVSCLGGERLSVNQWAGAVIAAVGLVIMLAL